MKKEVKAKKVAPVPKHVFDEYKQGSYLHLNLYEELLMLDGLWLVLALKWVLDFDEEDVIDRWGDYFEEAGYAVRPLPESATEFQRNCRDLEKHYNTFVKGHLDKDKAKILTNFGAYRFFCSVQEMHERPPEERMTIKQYATEYWKDYGMY